MALYVCHLRVCHVDLEDKVDDHKARADCQGDRDMPDSLDENDYQDVDVEVPDERHDSTVHLHISTTSLGQGVVVVIDHAQVL